MSNTFQIYLISDSTGETLDRIFLALKAQFNNIEYKVHPYSFTRTENQIIKILEIAKKTHKVLTKRINEKNVFMFFFVFDFYKNKNQKHKNKNKKQNQKT